MAGEQPQAPSSASEPADRRSSSLRQRWRPLRWLLVGALGVALVAVIGVAVIRLQPRPAATRPAAPDVLGTTSGSCVKGDGPETGAALLFYDAKTGKRLRKVDLDATVLPATLPSSVLESPTLRRDAYDGYFNLAWSPTGKTLAMIYQVGHSIQEENESRFETYSQGLLNLDTSSDKIAYLPLRAVEFDALHPVGDEHGSGHIRLAQLDTMGGGSRVLSLPRTFAYTWSADGTLAPAQTATGSNTFSLFSSGNQNPG